MNKGCLYIILFAIVLLGLIYFFPQNNIEEVIETISDTVSNSIPSVTAQAGGNVSNELKNILECSKILDKIM